MPVIIFDLDGTLVDTQIDWDEVRSKVRKVLGLDNNAPLKPLATSLLSLYRYMPKFNEALKIVEEEELRSIRVAKFDEELPLLLRRLKKCGFKLALVTLRSKRTSKPLMNIMGIEKLFDIVITRDDIPYREEQLKRVLNTFMDNEVIFITDFEYEVNIAKHLGIKVFLVKSYRDTSKIIKDILNNCLFNGLSN